MKIYIFFNLRNKSITLSIIMYGKQIFKNLKMKNELNANFWNKNNSLA